MSTLNAATDNRIKALKWYSRKERSRPNPAQGKLNMISRLKSLTPIMRAISAAASTIASLTPRQFFGVISTSKPAARGIIIDKNISVI